MKWCMQYRRGAVLCSVKWVEDAKMLLAHRKTAEKEEYERLIKEVGRAKESLKEVGDGDAQHQLGIQDGG